MNGYCFNGDTFDERAAEYGRIGLSEEGRDFLACCVDEVKRLRAELARRENVPLEVTDDALEVCRGILDESYSCDLEAFQAKCRRVVEWSDANPRVGPPIAAALRGDPAP